jgi:hypothetical protein
MKSKTGARRVGRPPGQNDVCGHLDRKHSVRGKCAQCYERERSADPKTKAALYAHDYGADQQEALGWHLIANADRICWMCGKPGDKLQLDHHHATRTIRGWAHKQCNMAEGLIGSSPNPKRLLETLQELHAL